MINEKKPPPRSTAAGRGFCFSGKRDVHRGDDGRVNSVQEEDLHMVAVHQVRGQGDRAHFRGFFRGGESS